jgi:hypothetical protein
MAAMAVAAGAATGDPSPNGNADDVRPSADRSFLRWGAATYGVVLAVLVLHTLRTTHGRLVYVLDDPAIHLSVAENLVHHATWGVEAGHFQSASSSPLWTVLLAGYLLVSPLSDALGPLLLNAAAAVAVIAVLGRNQTVLRPSLRRPVDALAVAALVTVPLFLPALTMVGMEHVLHMALVLGAVVLFHRRERGDPWGPAWLPYVVLALATLARLETAFVAAGIGVALIARCLPASEPGEPSEHNGHSESGEHAAPLGRQLRKTALVGLSAALPLAVIAAFTRLMGQGMLPNSVLAKARTDPQNLGHSLLRATFERFTTDPVLATLAAVAVGALIVAWRRERRYVFPATVFVVALGLHAVFARMGWYERYQAYLILLGVYAGLQLAADAVPVAQRRVRPALVPVLVLASLLFASDKVGLLTGVPEAVADTYEQRYQAGRFFDRYYDGEPVATGELGYVSLMHDGPITDMFGLGDYEVLRAWRANGERPPASYWEDLIRDRGVRVVAVYPSTLYMDTPSSWVLVGSWVLPHGVVTAFEPTFQFWATTPDEVVPLQRRLREFEAELPPTVEVQINELAPLLAAQRSAE